MRDVPFQFETGIPITKYPMGYRRAAYDWGFLARISPGTSWLVKPDDHPAPNTMQIKAAEYNRKHQTSRIEYRIVGRLGDKPIFRFWKVAIDV